MEPVVLDGVFRLWVYGVGHSQLVLHAPAAHHDQDAVSVLFEAVRAMKLRTCYPALRMRTADAAVRAQLLDFAGVPELFRDAALCLTLPTVQDGFVVCGKATVLAGKQPPEGTPWRPPRQAAVLHTFTQPAPCRALPQRPAGDAA